jgi:chromosome segregation ATPase
MLLSSTLLGSLSQNQQGYTTTGTPTRDKEGAEEADAPKRGPRRLSPDATPTATPTETPRPAKQQPQLTSVAGKGLPEVPLKKLAEKDAKKTRALPPTPSAPEIPPGPTQQEVDHLKRALAESLQDKEDLKKKLAEMERAVLPTTSALAIPPGPTQKEVDHLKRALADAQQFINDVMDKQDMMDKGDLKELAGKDAAKTRALPPTPSTPATPPGPTVQEVDELKRALAEAFKDKQDLKQKLDEESNQNGLRKGDCIKALTHLNQELKSVVDAQQQEIEIVLATSQQVHMEKENYINELRDNATALTEELDAISKEYIKGAKDMRQGMVFLEEHNSALVRSLSHARDRLEESKQNSIRKEDCIKALTDLNKEMDRQLKCCKEELTRCENDLAQAMSAVQELTAELDALRRRMVLMEEKKSEIEAQRNDIERVLATSQQDNFEKEKYVEELKSQVQSLTFELDTSSGNAKELTAELDALQTRMGLMEEYNNELRDNAKGDAELLDALRQRIMAQQQEIEIVRETSQQDDMQNEDYIKKLRDIADHVKAEKGQMEKEYNALLDVVEAESLLRQKNDADAAADAMKELETIERQLTTTQEKLEAASQLAEKCMPRAESGEQELQQLRKRLHIYEQVMLENMSQADLARVDFSNLKKGYNHPVCPSFDACAAIFDAARFADCEASSAARSADSQAGSIADFFRSPPTGFY